MENKNDFSQGNIYKHIMGLAIPMTIAQMYKYFIIQLIEYLQDECKMVMLQWQGFGVAFPIVLLVSAFAAFVGMGGAPLAAIKMGEKIIMKQKNND